MSEQFYDLEKPELRPPRQFPQGPWVNIVLVAVVVIGFLVMGVSTALAQGRVMEKLTLLSADVVEVSTELADIKEDIEFSTDGLQSEIGGMASNVAALELWTGSLSATLESLEEDVEALTVTAAALDEIIAAGNFTAP